MYERIGFYIPDRMMTGLRLWIETGTYPGDFLTAVITNNLKEACARADDENLRNLPAFVMYLYNEAPALCWGSVERAQRWHEIFAQKKASKPNNKAASTIERGTNDGKNRF